jgi:5-methylcytosine-specific restriction endonuclease McrA
MIFIDLCAALVGTWALKARKRRLARLRRGAGRQPIPPRVRARVLARECQWPGCPYRAEHVHHRHPVARGGTNAPGNLLGLCSEHHKWAHGAGQREARRIGVLV